MDLIGWIIDGLLWFFAFKNAKGSIITMVGLRILYGILFVAFIAAFIAAVWLLFGHVTHRAH